MRLRLRCSVLSRQRHSFGIARHCGRRTWRRGWQRATMQLAALRTSCRPRLLYVAMAVCDVLRRVFGALLFPMCLPAVV